MDQLIDDCNVITWVFGGTGLMFAMWLEIGRMLSWSSMTTQFLHDARDRMNLETVEQKQNWLENGFPPNAPTFPKKGEHLPLIEPPHHVLMSLCPVSRVNVLKTTKDAF